MEAQRYPGRLRRDVAGAPVNNHIHLNVSQAALQVEMLRIRRASCRQTRWRCLPMPSWRLRREGRRQGQHRQRSAQRASSIPAMMCKAGDAADCLTAAQVETARSA